MLPRLEAERELGAINAMALAFGGVRPADRRRHLARLQKLTRGAGEVAKATPAILAAMGVAVIQMPAKDMPHG